MSTKLCATGWRRQDRPNSATLSSMCDHRHPVGPYHIINASIVLNKSNERAYRLRGSDNFILSPLYCGSNATGWQSTGRYMGDELTVPTAMAISGARRSSMAREWLDYRHPQPAGSECNGAHEDLFDFTGYWVPEPRMTRVPVAANFGASCTKSFRSNYFDPNLKEVLGLGLTEESPACPAQRRRAVRESRAPTS